MGKFLDLTGRKFGRLTAIERVDVGKPKVYWRCKCDCGNESIVAAYSLTSGNTKSCGCLHREITSKTATKHGLTKNGAKQPRIYRIWSDMKRRCYSETFVGFENYGGRGITVCDEWRNDFRPFYKWAMANGYRDDLSIDRIDVNGNYEPSNCRWSTPKEQARNRRTNVAIEVCGMKKLQDDWLEELHISPHTMYRHRRNDEDHGKAWLEARYLEHHGLE